MRSVDDLLDRAKDATSSKNDSELAKHLGIRPAAVSNYRRGVSLPNAVVCATLAGLTGEPLARVLGIVGEARAISTDEKAVWRKLAATAMALLVGAGFAYFQGDAGAALAAMVPLAVTDPLYIMRNALSAASAGSGFGLPLTYCSSQTFLGRQSRDSAFRSRQFCSETNQCRDFWIFVFTT